MPEGTSMKKSICYIDDDEAEIKRFRENLGDRYILGTGTTFEAAIKALQEEQVSKPDLFLLDLYFGPKPDEEKRKKCLRRTQSSPKWSVWSGSSSSTPVRRLRKGLSSLVTRQRDFRVFLVPPSADGPTWRMQTVFWVRNRQRLEGFLVGILGLVAKIGWDLLRDAW
jgi:hypothetical protein